MRNVLMIKEEETQLNDWEHHMEHHPACRADGEIHGSSRWKMSENKH